VKTTILSLLVAVGIVGSASAAVVAEWKLDGNANDSIGAANGSATGVTWVTSNFNGYNRIVAQMNGSGGISVSNISSTQLGSSFSLSAWVNVANWGSTGGNNGYSIFDAGEPSSWPSNPHEAAVVGSLSGNTVDFRMCSTDQYWQGDIASGSRYIYSDPSMSTSNPNWSQVNSGIQTNNWNLITWTFDGTQSKAYLNGTILNYWQGFSQGTNLSPYNFHYFQIGSNLNGDQNIFNGMLANLQVYNTALTSSQVSQLYALQSVPEPSTYALFGLGIGGILLAYRRKRLC